MEPMLWLQRNPGNPRTADFERSPIVRSRISEGECQRNSWVESINSFYQNNFCVMFRLSEN